MRLVDRLILRELFGPLLNSIFMFLMLLFTSAYLAKLTDLMVRGASFNLVAKVALYTLPQLITQTLPMGLLLGTILAMGRLSGDSEHIALFACGVSFYRVAVPIGVLGLLTGVAAFAWNETVVPPATRQMTSLMATVVQDMKATDTPLFFSIKRKNSDVIDEMVYIHGGYDKATRSLRKVTIVKMSDEMPGLPEVVMYAERVVAHDAKVSDWDFYDAYVKYLRPQQSGRFMAETYHKFISTESGLPANVRMGRDFKGVMQADVVDNRTMTFRQLSVKIRDERAVGDPQWMADEFDLWSKLSIPLASLIFALVAAPLGLRPQRGNKTMGFGIAVSIIFLYWVVHQWMFQVAKGGQLSPVASAFTADIFGLIAAIVLIARTRQ